MLLLITLIAVGLLIWTARRRRRRTPPAPRSFPPTANLYHYTSRAGDAFVFDIQPHGQELRAYIIGQPSYGTRPDDGESTHRLGLNDGRPYVCVDTRYAPTNGRHAREWAVYWAEGTSRYIRTGRKFS